MSLGTNPEQIADRVLVTGAAATGLGWLSVSDWAAIVGVAVMVLGFVAGLVFRIRADRRAVLQHMAIMDRIKYGKDESPGS